MNVSLGHCFRAVPFNNYKFFIGAGAASGNLAVKTHLSFVGTLVTLYIKQSGEVLQIHSYLY